MKLFAKKVLLDFIKEHPEEEAAMLEWSKRFEHERYNPTLKTEENRGYYMALGMVGTRQNYSLMDHYRTDIGFGYVEYIREFVPPVLPEEGSEDEQHEVLEVSFKIELTPPPLPLNEKGEPDYGLPESSPYPATQSPEKETQINVPEIKNEREYNTLLKKALQVFNVNRKDKKQLAQLTAWLNRIHTYESIHYELPPLRLIDLVKYKIKLVNSNKSYLFDLFDNQQAAADFWENGTYPGDKILWIICKQNGWQYLYDYFKDTSLSKRSDM